jgi:hypothetical protein
MTAATTTPATESGTGATERPEADDPGTAAQRQRQRRPSPQRWRAAPDAAPRPFIDVFGPPGDDVGEADEDPVHRAQTQVLSAAAPGPAARTPEVEGAAPAPPGSSGSVRRHGPSAGSRAEVSGPSVTPAAPAAPASPRGGPVGKPPPPAGPPRTPPPAAAAGRRHPLGGRDSNDGPPPSSGPATRGGLRPDHESASGTRRPSSDLAPAGRSAVPPGFRALRRPWRHYPAMELTAPPDCVLVRDASAPPPLTRAPDEAWPPRGAAWLMGVPAMVVVLAAALAVLQWTSFLPR